MSKQTPKAVHVYLKKGKHKSQPWTFLIDLPGGAPMETKRTRYARKDSAQRGALRMLGAVTSGGTPGTEWGYTGGFKWFYKTTKGKFYPVEFTEVQ
jgi:hypothetical protein